MNTIRKCLVCLATVVACALLPVHASFASPSDTADVQATVKKWIAYLNKRESKPLIAACAPHAAIVDGFPPYAWQTCADWWSDYQANNKAIQGTDSKLELGKLIYEELNGNRAYIIYPATFSDTQKGKSVVYKGTMTMTLKKTKNGWVFTGAASAWGVNNL
ncbi:MAG: hypothetical protein ABI035_04435 [Gemmatimonadaceae bacterium]